MNGSMKNAEQLPGLDLDLLEQGIATATGSTNEMYKILKAASMEFYEYEKRFALYSDRKLTADAINKLNASLWMSWQHKYGGANFVLNL